MNLLSLSLSLFVAICLHSSSQCIKFRLNSEWFGIVDARKHSEKNGRNNLLFMFWMHHCTSESVEGLKTHVLRSTFIPFLSFRIVFFSFDSLVQQVWVRKSLLVIFVFLNLSIFYFLCFLFILLVSSRLFFVRSTVNIVSCTVYNYMFYISACATPKMRIFIHNIFKSP